MRSVMAAFVAMTMIASGAIADPIAPQRTLAAGKPAGAKAAQIQSEGTLLVLGIAAAAGVIALVISEGTSKSTSISPTTTS